MSDTETTHFGKYELLTRIAVGGMSEIYRARYEPAPGVSKLIVIKRILPHFSADTRFIEMFTDEARIAMGLSHPNVAQVFDFGQVDGDYFLAMELVEGQTLSKVNKRLKSLDFPAVPVEYAVFIIIEILKGLHYAHTRRDDRGEPLLIVHRDVSPQNIVVGYEGLLKLVDFGIAKARNASREETQVGAMKGKYAYFSPEQARGRDLDARSDVFSAASVLYELVCGQLPFPGKMMDAVPKIVRGEFARPREVAPNVPEELEGILLKAMTHEKADRYESAEAFQQALEEFLGRAAPGFSARNISQLMDFLYESERVKEGRQVTLSREFLAKLPAWRAAPVVKSGKSASQPDLHTVAARPKRSTSWGSLDPEATAKAPSPDAETEAWSPVVTAPGTVGGTQLTSSKPSPKQVWGPLFIMLPLAAMAVSALIVWAVFSLLSN